MPVIEPKRPRPTPGRPRRPSRPPHLGRSAVVLLAAATVVLPPIAFPPIAPPALAQEPGAGFDNGGGGVGPPSPLPVGSPTIDEPGGVGPVPDSPALPPGGPIDLPPRPGAAPAPPGAGGPGAGGRGEGIDDATGRPIDPTTGLPRDAGADGTAARELARDLARDPARDAATGTSRDATLGAISVAGGGPLADLAGRTVIDVRVEGNRGVPTATVLQVARTRPGTPFDPAAVREDYQRIFALRKFGNVEARVEPVDARPGRPAGVVVVFQVTEQKQVNAVRFIGNTHIPDRLLRPAIEVEPGEAIDPFRIALGRRAIEAAYQRKNYAFARAEVDREQLDATGDLVYRITEGPRVRVRDVNFVGNEQIGGFRLGRQVRTSPYFFIFRSGNFSEEQVEDDVAAVRAYYLRKGFFDARVGRKVTFSPDNSEVRVDFLIDEGPRYTVTGVEFVGLQSVDEAALRGQLKLVAGEPYDAEVLQRDLRRVVAAYGPTGQIFEPGSTDPDYLTINPRPVFGRVPGELTVRYDVREGRPFTIGDVLVRGNTRTQEKVVLRELKVAPGQRYDSAALQDAQRRLRATPYFTSVRITPVGTDPGARDVLVEVEEARTALLTVGAGVNSNGGVGANITYLQRNFDITNFPDSFSDTFSDQAFTGAGQLLRISLEPGTQSTNASIYFREPYLFDQPYGFSAEAYYRDRDRLDFDERRAGGRLALSRRFGELYAAEVGLRAEDVLIHNIQDEPIRAFEILDTQGHNFLTSLGFQLKRDSTDRGPLPGSGSVSTAGVEFYGALGGDYSYQQFTLSHDRYYTLYEDLLDRRTTLSLRADGAYLTGDSPFFNRLYAGGIGSLRGFTFRGVTPRSGPSDDRVGGDFSVTGTAELGFPLAGDTLRGVVFTDVGTVEPGFEVGTIRSSVGAGVRVTLDLLGQIPVAVDFAVPITKDGKDDTQLISFSLGILQ